jgi:DNA mismatch endonuclease (patch repair protein)
MDKISRARRSANMAAIKSRDTKPEMVVRRYLFKKGLRYRTHVKRLPGRPDVAIKKYKLVLEVRGCFWHGHAECRDGRLPKSNTEFWASKIQSTIDRDARNLRDLEAMGYSVHVIWECEIKANKMGKVDAFVKQYRARKDIEKR